jgi:subtilase family serine protease
MSIQTAPMKMSSIVPTLLAVLLLIGSGFSQSSTSRHAIANNTPRFGADAQDLGPEESARPISVTVWLNQRNKADLDSLVQQMYQKDSPNYHHWLTHDEYTAKFAPTAEDAMTVHNFLEAHNLKVSAIDRDNHFLTARGKIADVQKAFQVQINRYSVRGELHRGNIADPTIEGPAGALVSAVQGLTDLTYKSHARRLIDPETGAPFPFVPLTAAGPNGSFFSRNCFRSPETETFVTPGGGPTGTYTGNRYGSDITSKVPNLPPCGYSPSEVQTAYGLPAIYKKWRGKGQTIVIADAYGSPTIGKDANTFSQLYHLPALTSSNFKIVKIGGPTGCTPAEGCSPAGWDVETTLDVEWAHAIAPDANILLLQAFDNTSSNLNQAVLYAAEGGGPNGGVPFGNVISNSYGGFEDQTPAAELGVENSINELAAAFGVSANFSTGDSGDFSTVLPAATVSNPADSPFATAVGGTSLFINKDKTMKFQTGWGNNLTRIADVTPNPPVVPPLLLGFDFGSGGGTSAFFSKPSFQRSLSGGKRKLPDIAYIADPFTGVEIIITQGGQQFVTVIGGTSLACPTFSALWALANQAAGGPLGQAAPLLYQLPADAITDIQQIGSADNVTGVISFPPFKPVFESAKALAQPLYKTKNFVSAIYNSPFSTRWFVLTFGTDTSLTTGVGWDNMTGLGTPNGLAFIQGVVGLAAPAAAASSH